MPPGDRIHFFVHDTHTLYRGNGRTRSIASPEDSRSAAMRRFCDYAKEGGPRMRSERSGPTVAAGPEWKSKT